MKTRLIATALTLTTALSLGIVVLASQGGAQTDTTPASISVQVNDDEGDAIRGATVIVETASGKELSRSTTDAAGQTTAHYPAGGQYRVRTVLPTPYTPLTDSDSTVIGHCGNADQALCVTTDVAGGRVYTLEENGVISKYPVAAHRGIWFRAVDPSPQPRLSLELKDRADRQPLPGGTLTVTNHTSGKQVFNGTTDGTETLTSLTPGYYVVQWTPPSGYTAESGGNAVISVQKATSLPMWASTTPEDTTSLTSTVSDTIAYIDVYEVGTKNHVPGAGIRVSFYEDGQLKSDDYTSTDDTMYSFRRRTTTVQITSAPKGYEIVGIVTSVVPDGERRDVTFTVRKLAEPEQTGVAPGGQDANAVGGTPGQAATPAPTSEAPGTTNAPAAPPVNDEPAPTTTEAPGTSAPTPSTTEAPATTAAPTTEAPTPSTTEAPATSAPAPTTAPPTTAAPTTTEPAPTTTEAPANNVGSTRPRCDIPANYEICLELGYITYEEYLQLQDDLG